MNDWTVRRHRARSVWTLAVCAVAVAVVAVPAVLWPGRGLPPVWVSGRVAPPATSDAVVDTIMSAGPPDRVRIPAIGVDTGLVELRLDGAGALESPADYQTPGWYAEGTPPGDTGPAVIAGHVDSRTGPAVFHRLRDLQPGDVVQVRRGGRWIDFEVTATGRYPKDHFPTAEVYGPTPDPQLRLITCGGLFDRSRDSYRDNVVVYAIIRGDV